MSAPALGLPEALERAASALPGDAEAIRPANGDPSRLLEQLDAEAAPGVLVWLLVNEPEAAAELAEAWCDEGEAGARALLAVREAGLPKGARKLLRRTRHRLRSRGVEVPEEPAPALVATLPPVDDALEQALVTAIDPRGVRAVYLVEAHPAGGARLFELMLDDERGVVEFEVYSAGRSRVRRFLREFRGRDRLRAVEAPPESVRALVGRVAGRQPDDRPLPRGFVEWRARVAEAPEGASTPGELARRELGDQAEPGALERVAERVRDGSLGPWPPAQVALRAAAQKIAAVGSSPIVVSGARRRERADRALEEAVADLFDEGFAARTATRLEETAYVDWKEGRPDAARDCLAAAAGLREGACETHPVARALVELWLKPALDELEKETADEGGESLIVGPAPR